MVGLGQLLLEAVVGPELLDRHARGDEGMGVAAEGAVVLGRANTSCSGAPAPAPSAGRSPRKRLGHGHDVRLIPISSKEKNVPVRPTPAWMSSMISSAPCFLASRAMPLHPFRRRRSARPRPARFEMKAAGASMPRRRVAQHRCSISGSVSASGPKAPSKGIRVDAVQRHRPRRRGGSVAGRASAPMVMP
jgi:hypothetical protein